MNSAWVESGVIRLICFMIVSARALVNEPKIYGPMRLVEATQRFICLVEHYGAHDELLAEVAKRIEEYPLDVLPEGEEEFIAFMDDLVALLATWVEQSYVAPKANGEGR